MTKFEELLQSVRTRAKKIVPNCHGMPGKPTQSQSDGCGLWDWAYCFDEELKWFIGWGFSVGGKSWDFHAVELPDGTQAFVKVSKDPAGKSILLEENEKKKFMAEGWVLAEGKRQEIIKSRSLREFSHVSQQFGDVTNDWFLTAIKEAIEILQSASRSAPVST